jgi:hypothetical protein
MNDVSVELDSDRQNTLSRPESKDSLIRLLKRCLGEPLLHFLLIGLALFAVYSYMHRGRAGVESSRQVLLTFDECTPGASAYR